MDFLFYVENSDTHQCIERKMYILQMRKRIWTKIILKQTYFSVFSIRCFFFFLVKVRVASPWTQLLRAHQHTESRLNFWVALSRTVQPENGDFRLNLRFVSPWNANSPQQIKRRNSKKKKNKKSQKNPVRTVLQHVWYSESKGIEWSAHQTDN